MKAFLSHSSKNKEFIREVANKLGRLHSIFDERSFDTGVEFENSIIKFLDKTSIFVFFATKESLASSWVNFELNEAFYRKINSQINNALVYIIDSEVSISDIPNWMQKSLVSKLSSPAAIAREIKEHLLIIEQTYQHQYFIGRSNDREEFEDILNPIDGSTHPKVFGIRGLPGVGRRTFLKKSIDELFNLKRIIEIPIEEGDNLNDICSKLADIIEPYSSKEELKDIILAIQTFDENSTLDRINVQLNNIISAGELPVFIDYGGLLNDNGYINEFINKLIIRINKEDDIYLAIISSRSINRDNEPKVPVLYLDSLKDKPTAQLLSKLNIEKSVGLNREEISELVTYVHGYPPSAFFAINQGATYGKDLLMSDKSSLTQFSRKKFIVYLKEKVLDTDLSTFLAILAAYSPLPLKVLATINEDENKTHETLYRLIDNSLITIDSSGYYKISAPIKEVVNDLYKFPDKTTLQKIAIALNQYMDEVEDKDEKQLDLSRILFRLGNWLDDKTSINKGIKLRSDYIKMLEQAYHQRDYDKAIKYGFDAIKEAPENQKARNYIVKSLIQLEKWEAASEQIDAMEEFAELRNIYYLEGFLERKKGDIQKAITAFKQSEKNGRKSPDIKRELAHCYLLTEEFELANNYIKEAIELQPDNNHVVDLAAKIAISQKNEDEALKRLKHLQALDTSEYYYLRYSTFHYTFGRYPEAIASAKKAIDISIGNFFSAKVQYIKSLIKNKNFNIALTELNKLDVDFNNNRHDVRYALRCSYLMENNEFKKAYIQASKMIEKQSKQYKSIRKKCLLNLIKNQSIPYSERQNYHQELNSLSNFNDTDVLEEIIL
ncbi:MAG: TIR domain-containing protein [Sulfurimonadaceae bacterium]